MGKGEGGEAGRPRRRLVGGEEEERGGTVASGENGKPHKCFRAQKTAFSFQKVC